VENVPSDVIERCKFAVLDLVGIGIASSRLPIGAKLHNFIRKLNSRKEESSIWGTNVRTDSFLAAFANATATLDLELDDVHRTSHTHPGVSVIPTAIALCEKVDGSGTDLILSTIAGYEVVTRIGLALSPSILRDMVWHSPSFLGSWGSAAAASKVLGLDETKIVNALSIAGGVTPAATFEAFRVGSDLKNLYMGFANLNGIMAALLAEKDFTGTPTIIEGELGFAKIAAKEYNLERLIEGLGEKFEIRNCSIKLHSCCRQVHPTIDAILDLRNKYGIGPEDVEEIIVRTFSVAARANNPDPKTITAAKYSIQYVVAVALIDGEVSIRQFTEKKLKDPQVLNLLKKVKVVADEKLDRLYDEKWPAIVDVRTKDGKEYSEYISLPRGEPENPLSMAEIKEKFMGLATTALSNEKSEELFKMIINLEKVENIGELSELLTS